MSSPLAEEVPTPVVASRKDTVRRLALLARSRVPAEARASAATVVAHHLLALPEIAAAARVLAFASFGQEIATDDLLEALLEAGKRVFLPYVETEGEMRAAEITSLGDLAPGYRGIREPVRREPVTGLDAAIVPGVAFDARGRRLGYGGGFFDRFLETLPPGVPVIGICFEAQIVEEVPSEEHDVPVSAVVTESRVIRPG
jgi:5-formyltetrahydrofolate cyclo-ligase